MKPSDVCKEKTTFVGRFVKFRLEVMTLELMNGQMFQRLMDHILKGLTFVFVQSYLQDVVILSETLEEHVERVQKVMERIEKHYLEIKMK